MSELQAVEHSDTLDDYIIEKRILAWLAYIDTRQLELRREIANLQNQQHRLTRRTANLEDHRRLLEYRAHRLTELSATASDGHLDGLTPHDLPPDPAANHPWWWHATLDLLAESPGAAHSAPELHRRLTDLGFSVTRATPPRPAPGDGRPVRHHQPPFPRPIPLA